MIKEDRLYTITSGAQFQEFSNYLPTAKKMLDSFVIYSQEEEVRPKITALFGTNLPATEPDAAPPTELLVLRFRSQ